MSTLISKDPSLNITKISIQLGPVASFTQHPTRCLVTPWWLDLALHPGMGLLLNGNQYLKGLLDIWLQEECEFILWWFSEPTSRKLSCRYQIIAYVNSFYKLQCPFHSRVHWTPVVIVTLEQYSHLVYSNIYYAYNNKSVKVLTQLVIEVARW